MYLAAAFFANLFLFVSAVPLRLLPSSSQSTLSGDRPWRKQDQIMCCSELLRDLSSFNKVISEHYVCCIDLFTLEDGVRSQEGRTNSTYRSSLPLCCVQKVPLGDNLKGSSILLECGLASSSSQKDLQRQTLQLIDSIPKKVSSNGDPLEPGHSRTGVPSLTSSRLFTTSVQRREVFEMEPQ